MHSDAYRWLTFRFQKASQIASWLLRSVFIHRTAYDNLISANTITLRGQPVAQLITYDGVLHDDRTWRSALLSALTSTVCSWVFKIKTRWLLHIEHKFMVRITRTLTHRRYLFWTVYDDPLCMYIRFAHRLTQPLRRRRHLGSCF